MINFSYLEMVCWQNTRLFLTSKLEYLMKSKCLSDVLFIVGKQPNRMKFHSHKFMFSIYSDVFESMFDDPSNNTKNAKQMIIRINDIEGHIFEKMFKFIYTEEVDHNDLSDTVELYFLSKKYNILPLMTECKAIIEAEVTSENVCIVYRFALSINDESLIAKCENIIKTETMMVLKSESFMKSSLEIVERIASFDFLFIPKEVVLYDSILCWATEEARRQGITPTPNDLRNIMYPITTHIRFLSMTQEELFNRPVRSGIFKKEEIVGIAMHKSQPDLYPSLPEWCSWKRGNRIENIDIKKSESQLMKICIPCKKSIIKKNLYVDCIVSPLWTDFALQGITLCFKKSTEIPTLQIFEQNKASRFIRFKEEDETKSEKDGKYKIKLLSPIIMIKNHNYYIKMNTVNPVTMCNHSVSVDRELIDEVFFSIMYKIHDNCHISEILCTVVKETIL
ncbi:BTB/POZ domain-containing protein 6-like isoform X2 [Centruroides sculpturatus]|uniref:BTB/POZ domain-containing protein 6-like isoform X2 n=1 Tax=Centruroides sculpturatus TaxID=218467 RepID=UPI000C6EBC64|nr:BTB/POZ domain-containing protein 6-like isoform X2 [Centruroides sculpturatus]